MNEAERVKRTAVAVVFGGVVSSLQAHDEEVASQVVRQLWPPMIDLSGYEIAAECVLAMVGAFAISDEALDELAIRAMAEAREGMEDDPAAEVADDDPQQPLPFAHDSLDDLDDIIDALDDDDYRGDEGDLSDLANAEPEPEPEPAPTVPVVDMAAIIAQANIDAGVTKPTDKGE